MRKSIFQAKEAHGVDGRAAGRTGPSSIKTKDGQPILTRGYGVKAMDRPGAADARTLFAVASNTKAVTCAALSILIETALLFTRPKLRG